MITRLVLYATLGTLCSVLGFTWDSWQFWSLLGLFWAADRLAHQDGKQSGYVEGIYAYMHMDAEHKQRIEELVKEVRGK